IAVAATRNAAVAA
ncbi:hypothetical protein A2U01_0098777, partial [Trifolium medium]|nr:hypothetical protein [Trifolium medium]MCI77507.1 hypothetical protein [Trifolium medium]